MNRLKPVLIGALAVFAIAAAAAPEPVGQYARWGAFKAADGESCYAIAEPMRSGRESRGAVTISSWPARGLFRQVHVRLAGPADGRATLAIGERRFAIVTRQADGWPAFPGDSRRIARLMREGGTLRVSWRSITGRRIAHVYALAGAASAIDAADLACLRK